MSKELVTAPAPKLPHARKTNETELAPAKETPVDRFHKLQRTLGNRRVAELIRTKRLSTEGRIINLQPKLTVGAADDPHEREADRAAQHVLSIPDSALHGAESNHRTSEDQEAKKVARSIQLDPSHPGHGSFEAGEEFESRLNASRGRGSALPDHVRSYMEPRFGADFSHVRVHTGNEAAELNRAVGARAFAHGSEIYYGSGYAPGHLELTAHELTHVIQQTGGARREDLTRKCEACSSGGGLCPQCEKEKDQVRRLPDIHSKPDRNIARSSFETAAPVTSIPAAAPAYTPATPSASDGRTLPTQPAGPDPALEATQRPDLGPFHPEIDHPAGIPASLSAGPPNIGRSPPQMSATLSFKMTMSSAGPPLMGTAFYRPITSGYVQRTDSNAYIAPSLECQVRQRKAPSIQRDSLNPLEWAASLLQSITADADRDQSQVQKQAGDRAAQLQSQGASQGNDLKSRSETGGLSLLDDAKTQGSQLSAQSTSQGQALETQGSTESAQLTGQSEASSQAIQQESSGATSKLQSDFGALDSRSRSAAGEAAGSVAADAGRLQMEGSTADMQVRNQWQALGSQASAGVQAAQNRTQSLVDAKNALVREYQGARPHSPERFQSRWSEIQAQVAAAERGDGNFQHVENTGQNLNTQASGSWSRISSRAQSLAQHFTGMAGGAWSSLQSGWAALQSAAAAKLTRVRQLADAEVTRIRSLATAAWTRLQTLATQFASRLRNLAEQAWNGLKSRGATAWAALQAAATAAWTALQSQAQSIIATIESAIKTLIGKINGAVGRIMQFLASAVSSLLARVRSLTDRALSFVRSTAASAWGTLRDVGTRAWQGLKDVAECAGTSLKDLGVRVWESLRDIGARTWNNLKAIGTRLWNTLKNLAEHALNALGRAWEWIKRQASAAWDWLKRAWERVKQVALRAWDWIKRKAQAAWTWLKRKWEWLKAMLRRALAWLKAAWKWLKSLVKITIRLPDVTWAKRINFRPWKFVDLDSGRIPFVKGIVETPLGPVELALFARAQAAATIGGSVCPCTLKNTTITLQPLISRYTGQTEIHIPGQAEEKLELTGALGGSANLGGAVGIAEGGLQATGSALGFGSLVITPRIVYDSGKVSFSERFRLEFCLRPTISLDAFARLVATTGRVPSPGGGGSPILPPGPIMSRGAGAYAGTTKKPPEKVLWEGQWHIGSITRLECWTIGAKYALTFDNSEPQLEVEADAGSISAGDVIRHMVQGMKIDPGGGVEIEKKNTASGICKCVGDNPCGGGRRYRVCVETQKDCKNAQKDVDDFCNNDSRMKERCVRPKCYYRHTEANCPDECTPGTIDPLSVEPGGGGGGGGTIPGRARPDQCQDRRDPCDTPLPIRWPRIMPVPSDRRPLIRTPSKDGYISPDKRSEPQEKLQKAIKDAQERHRRGEPGVEVPRPCFKDDDDPNAPYDAHHKQPLYLGGAEDDVNLCALRTDMHQAAHPRLNDQKDMLSHPVWIACRICGGYLPHHPGQQEYLIEGKK